MSATKSNSASKGNRYTPEQKKEILDFVTSYNKEKGRGGQTKAAEKYNVSLLTIGSWIKSAGSPSKPAKAATKAASAKKAAVKTTTTPAKAPAKKAAKAGVGTRYTPEQKKEVVDFAVAYNAANKGRGGQSKAAEKFGISPLTIMSWLKASGASKPSKKGASKAAAKAAKPAKAPSQKVGGDFDAKLAALQALRKEITKAESELAKLNDRFESLKASL